MVGTMRLIVEMDILNEDDSNDDVIEAVTNALTDAGIIAYVSLEGETYEEG